jgi:transposase InsO family protein
MSAKEALIFDVNGGKSISEAAKVQGVGRSCAYKWVRRVKEEGRVAGLAERSRRPENSPNRTPQALVDELLELKSQHPDWGPVTLVELLERHHKRHVMAVSTAGTILERHGQVQKRPGRRPGAGRIPHGPYEISGAGDTQTTDFKGQFRMGNGELCYPLTICDPFSRFVLDIVAMPSTQMAVTKATFERVFREYGVPRQIISDNGTPFCSANSLGGLTQLSRWWIEVGVLPVRIAPGRPDQNGIHERMHKTFKAWIKRHQRNSLRANQRSFDEFRAEFNYVRPHQALGKKTPDTAFKPYRPFSKQTAIEYESTMDVRKVNANGEIKWRGRPIFTSDVLIGANIGLIQVGEQLWSIHFGPVRIGFLDVAKHRVVNRAPEDADANGPASGGSEG